MDKTPPSQIRIIRDDGNENPPVSVAIQVEENLERLLATPPQGQHGRPSIYVIPKHIRDVKPEAFIPRLVSFGPYHHGEEDLLPMEQHKRRAFHNFQTSCGLPVSHIVQSVEAILDKLRGSYEKLDDKWNDKAKFLELMILDGCFMLETMILNANQTDFKGEGPIFSAHGRLNYIYDIFRDMLLLENQLPLELLDVLYFMKTSDRSNKVEDLVGAFVRPEVPTLVPVECCHVLHIYRETLLLPPVGSYNWSGENQDNTNDDGKKGKKDYEDQFIRPATQLREAGVVFKKSTSVSLKDVNFDKKRGVLSLPRLLVDDGTESAFLNVLAFEKLHIGVGNDVTAFVVLMDNLIDLDKDVALLASEKILVNAVGKDQDAAELFNLLAKGAVMEEGSHLQKVHKAVNMHCNTMWNVWCATLKATYFQNPWAIISLFAALLGFAIVIFQTSYQLLDYYKPADKK